MDFNDFNLRAASDEGRPYHVLNPATGDPMYDGDIPCIVLVRGVEGKATQEALRAIEAVRMTTGEDEKPSIDEIDAGIKSRAAVLLTGFVSGIDRGDSPAKAPDDVKWFLDLTRINMNYPGLSFAEQIAKAGADRGRLLGKG